MKVIFRKTKAIKFLLFIIAFYYLAVSSYYHEQYQFYSVYSQDPEYIHYICALSIANGKMRVGNIDNPGTTLQYFMAASFRITHLFREHIAPFTKDVLSHPDLYLKIFNTVMNAIIMLMLLFAGFLLFRYSGNIWYALIIQFSPFSTEIVYSIVGRIMPETLMPFFSVIFILIIMKLLFEKESADQSKIIFAFAVISALFLALKLTMTFLVILPLILLRSPKYKLYFIVSTLLIFLVFAIPVTLQLNYFWHWMKGLFIYAGSYGQGDKNILDVHRFIPNIVGLYKVNKSFFFFTLLFLISFTSAWFFKKKNTTRIQNLIALGILLVLLTEVIVLGKNFKTTYFIPALLLLPLMVILTVMYLTPFLPEKLRKFVAPVYIMLVITCFINEQRPSFLNLSVHYEQMNKQRMKTRYYFETLESNSVKFLIPTQIGAPVPQFSLMTSYQWSGRHQSFYKPYLAELYPNTYILYPWDKSMNYWGNRLNISGEKSVYIYFGNIEDKENLKDELAKYLPQNYTLKQLFFNPDTQEAIYQLN